MLTLKSIIAATQQMTSYGEGQHFFGQSSYPYRRSPRVKYNPRVRPVRVRVKLDENGAVYAHDVTGEFRPVALL